MNRKMIGVLILTVTVLGCGYRTGTVELQIRKMEMGKSVTSSMRLDPSKTAIVVVDMWHHGGHGFINPDGTFTGTNEGYFYQNHVADSINETLCAARSLGFNVVFAPAGQTYLYENHPARKNIKAIPRVSYPWDETPAWNMDQRKIIFADYAFEYDYAYPHTRKENNRPGTITFGQSPRLVMDDSDYMTEDVEELWNLIQHKGIQTLIYMGGSSNMCLAGRPFGVLNMIKYGVEVLVDRNYAHLVHRIPNGWNGDIDNPQYGPFFTNERNSHKVISYYEEHICPTIDGMEFRKLADAHGGYSLGTPPLKELQPDFDDLKISFQTQLIEVPMGYHIDIGWEYGRNAYGLAYGWNRLKIKDGLRETHDPLTGSYVQAMKGDKWKIELPPQDTHVCLFKIGGAGEVLVNGVVHHIDKKGEEIRLESKDSVDISVIAGTLNFYEAVIRTAQD